VANNSNLSAVTRDGALPSQPDLQVRAFARAIHSYPDRLAKDPRIRFDQLFMEICGEEFLLAAEAARHSAEEFRI
jgi:hypothetical protein